MENLIVLATAASEDAALCRVCNQRRCNVPWHCLVPAAVMQHRPLAFRHVVVQISSLNTVTDALRTLFGLPLWTSRLTALDHSGKCVMTQNLDTQSASDQVFAAAAVLECQRMQQLALFQPQSVSADLAPAVQRLRLAHEQLLQSLTTCYQAALDVQRMVHDVPELPTQSLFVLSKFTALPDWLVDAQREYGGLTMSRRQIACRRNCLRVTFQVKVDSPSKQNIGCFCPLVLALGHVHVVHQPDQVEPVLYSCALGHQRRAQKLVRDWI